MLLCRCFNAEALCCCQKKWKEECTLKKGSVSVKMIESGWQLVSDRTHSVWKCRAERARDEGNLKHRGREGRRKEADGWGWRLLLENRPIRARRRETGRGLDTELCQIESSQQCVGIRAETGLNGDEWKNVYGKRGSDKSKDMSMRQTAFQ